MARVVIPGFRKIEVSGSGEGGTSNYNDLSNKPSINNVPLVGNLNTANLKLTDSTLTEEGVPAEAKTVGAKLAEQSTSLLKLTEQLVNHTVKSDVPENAVFTDTVYDDTEVKESIEELNSNLDTLSYGDESGNSNLLNLNKCSFNKNNISISLEDNEITVNGSYYSNLLFDKLLDAGSYSISFKVKSATSDYSVIRVLYEDDTYSDAIYYAKNIVAEKKLKGLMLYSSDSANVGTTVFKNIQIEKGTTATSYEPYIPSVKMLAEENVHQSNEAMDLKMLGWNVPKECPIQNYVDSDGVFHQRVGRVDLGSLEWTYDTLWKATSGVSTIKNLTVNMYHSVYVPTIANVSDMPTNSVKKADSDTLWINNGSSTEKPSGYLYFELATEKTIKVDGNEAVTKVNDSLGALGKCKNLLKPTLKTTEKKWGYVYG